MDAALGVSAFFGIMYACGVGLSIMDSKACHIFTVMFKIYVCGVVFGLLAHVIYEYIDNKQHPGNDALGYIFMFTIPVTIFWPICIPMYLCSLFLSMMM